MSSIDINIIQRGITNNFEWSAEQGTYNRCRFG